MSVQETREYALEVLKRARLVLSAGFWGKNDYTKYKHRGSRRHAVAYCALGASAHAADKLKDRYNHTESTSALSIATDYLYGQIHIGVAEFNDRRDTDLYDVLRIYDGAIKDLERRMEIA